MQRTLCIAIIVAVGVCGPFQSTVLAADDLNDFSEKLKALTEALDNLQDTVELQQNRIEQLERENRTLRKDVDERPAPELSAAPPRPASSLRMQSLNPEIAVLVNVVGALTESGEDAEGNDRLSVREIELILGKEVDTYGRLDLTLAIGDFEEFGIEEAYFTYWALPAGLKARVGRIRPKIGNATALHLDRLETVDEPLVVQRYLGVEGLFLTGVEVSAFLPQVSDDLTQELIVGVMEGGIGEDGTLFGETRRRPSYYARLRNSWNFSDLTNMQLGAVYLVGSSDAAKDADVHALGVEATWTRNLDAVRRIKFQNELYAQFRDTALTPAATKDPYGFYSLLDFRLSRRWGVGGRYDWVEIADNAVGNPDDRDQAYTAYLTFFQSEFARIRAQYQHVDFASGDDDERFFLQFTYVMGVDKHPIQ